MSINLDLIDLVIIFGTMQGLFFAIVILSSKFFRTNANIFLGLSLIIIVLINVQTLFLKSSIYINCPRLRLFEDIELVLLFPVTLYFYYKASLNFDNRLNPKHLLLFLPFVISLLANLYVGGDVYFDWYSIEDRSWMPVFFGVEFYFSFVFNISLLVIEYFLIFRRKVTPNRLLEGNMKWVKIFYGFHVVLTIIWIVIVTLESLSQKDFSYIIWILINILFYWIGYKGILKFRLAKNRYEIRKVVEEKQQEKSLKPEGSSPQSSVNHYFTQMIRLFEEENIYRNPNLSRADIAERLGISVGYLSQIINEQSDKNIPDYLNYYRVEEVKKMLLDPDFDQYSLLAIGFEAGFNSKTAFYTAFKKETGTTPANFKKEFRIV
ncbi:helix-turn-helix domain-containing protein [Fulvivirga kasyanovii]|uniref:AraC family transcriptional regulator n=1 Tax=Fulvivirga kasyanovii TaxID=396812 RepID=A0ABW9RRA5_9BACT|nr:AraC family transcriptional regulator [Fulvivirga kasyanovii]